MRSRKPAAGSRWRNVYTKQEYEILADKSPRGGLYMQVKNLSDGTINPAVPFTGFHNHNERVMTAPLELNGIQYDPRSGVGGPLVGGDNEVAQ